MRRWIAAWGACFAGWAICASALAAAPTAGQIAGWLKQLDDEDYTRREEAGRQLLAAGEAAIDALAQGILSSSPEAAWRAGETLKQIAVEGNERQLERVAAALARLEKQGRPGMGKVVAEIRGRQKQMRHDRAAAQIRAAGGGLVGAAEGYVADIGFAPVALAMPMMAVEITDAVIGAEPVAPAAPPEVARDLGDAAPPALREAVKELFGDKEAADDPTKPPAVRLRNVDAPEDAAPVPPGAEADPAAPGAEDVPAEAPAEGELVLGGEAIVGPDAFFMIDEGGIEGAVANEVVESLTLDANWRGGDQALRAVRDLPDIASVEIRGARLTDEALTHLASLPKLQRLHLQGTKFSHKALHGFRAARPAVTVFCQGEAMLGIHADTTGPCVLTSVYFGSGAYEAGLRDGDKIVAVNGLPTDDFSDLTIAVYPHAPGDKLAVDFERDGKRQKVEVALKARNVLEKRSE